MKSKSLLRIMAVLVVLTTLVLAGCSSSSSSSSSTSQPADDKSDIIIGSAVPTTGSSAKMGTDITNGIKMAIDEINAKGGVLGGRKLKLEVQDDPCDPQQAVAAANKLVAMNVVAAISGYCSGSFLPTETVYNNAKVGVVVPAANATKLTQQKFDNINVMNPNGADQAKTAADFFVAKLGAKKVALIHDNSAYAKELADLTKAALQGKAEVVAFEAVTPGEKDFTATLTKVKGTNPDAIFWTGYYAEGGLIIKQAKGLGMKAAIMFGDGSNDPSIIDIAGKENAEGTYNTTTPGAADFAGTKDWIPQYKQKYGEPGPYSAQGYDSMYVIKNAIEAAKSTDRAAVAKAIRAINYNGLTGTVAFDESGNRKNGAFLVLQVKDGKFTVAQGVK